VSRRRHSAAATAREVVWALLRLLKGTTFCPECRQPTQAHRPDCAIARAERTAREYKDAA